MPLEILCIWFLSWNHYLTKHKDSTKIVLTHTHIQTQIHRRTKSNQILNKFKYVTKTNYSPYTVAALSQLQQNHQETKLHL